MGQEESGGVIMEGDPQISEHIVLPSLINGIPTSALYDPGSNASFISSSFARKHHITRIPLERPRSIGFADGDRPGKQVQHKAIIRLCMGEGEDAHEEILTAFVFDIQHDLILGLPWSETNQPEVNWETHEVKLSPERGPKCCRPSQHEHVEISMVRADDLNSETTEPGTELLYLLGYEWVQQPEACTVQVSVMNEHGVWWPPLEADLGIHAATTQQDYDIFMKGKPEVNIYDKLPACYQDLADAFSKQDAKQLPPFRPGIDHEIHLKPEGKAKPPFRKPYAMHNQANDAIKKWIDEQLAAGLIRRSNSPCASPVIVVKKPSGGLRVCVDYRPVNEMTIKNKYPIPLIRETLARMAGKRIFTKLDIIAAFNRIRIAEGHEWMTAFNTRYGQFECLVMPFGLCNAPATFQSYINDTLREFLDDFVSAYIDDALVFSDTDEEHLAQVRAVITRLRDAGLQIDIDKSEFHVRETRYLGLIVGVDGVKMDPAKVEAIEKWEQPQTIKDVQSFLGFANYYRQFIQKYSKVAAPLTDMTKGLNKGVVKGTGLVFEWTLEAQAAFEQLKAAFVKEPILKHFDTDLPTLVETDANDNVCAAVVSQQHKHPTSGKPVWMPTSYYSKKMNPAERNYDIYDKELLAIVKTLKEFRAELMSVQNMLILTDHKNLEYFTTTKMLNSRQARWAEELAAFDFSITYRPGPLNVRADALTRRPQDLPSEETLAQREQTLLPPGRFVEPPASVGVHAIKAASRVVMPPLRRSARQQELGGAHQEIRTPPAERATEPGSQQGSEPVSEQGAELDDGQNAYPKARQDTAVLEEQSLGNWREEVTAAASRDGDYQELVKALGNSGQEATIPAVLQRAKVNPGQCRVSLDGVIFMEHRCWVPQDENLRRRIVQDLHSAPAAGHPGIAGTLALIRRHFYWPKMSSYIRRYIAYCRPCRTTRSSNTMPQGLLHPLPVPGQPWSEIAMDFVGPLPASKSFEGVVYENILTVTCRLTKERHLIPVKSMTAKNTARILCRDVFSKHGLPHHALSDRGPQFTSSFMRYAYKAFGVDQRLTSSYHPQANGQAENTNKSMEKFLRAHVNYKQNDWVDWLWMAEFVANNSVSASTKVTPFFATRGTHPRMAGVDFTLPVNAMPAVASSGPRKIDEQSAQEFALEMTKVHQHLRQEMARTQLAQSEAANRLRQVHPNYNVGDLVYVSTRNWNTVRPTKKLDYRFAGPYRILARIGDETNDDTSTAPVTYKLELPTDLGVRSRDNAFHASLLQPATTAEGPLEGQLLEPPAPIEVLRPGDDEAEKEYEVERILDSKVKVQRGRATAGKKKNTWVEYLVKWKGYPQETWEHQDNVKGAARAVADYYSSSASSAVEPMPAELKSLLSTQEESSSASPLTEVQVHHVHGSGVHPLYPVHRGQVADAVASAHATTGGMQQPSDGSTCLPSTLDDHRAPSLTASSPTAIPLEGDDMEDDHAFALAMHGLRHGGPSLAEGGVMSRSAPFTSLRLRDGGSRDRASAAWRAPAGLPADGSLRTT